MECNDKRKKLVKEEPECERKKKKGKVDEIGKGRTIQGYDKG